MTTLVDESFVNSPTIQKGLQVQFMDNGVAEKVKHKALAQSHQEDVVEKQQPMGAWVELLAQQVYLRRTDAMKPALS